MRMIAIAIACTSGCVGPHSPPADAGCVAPRIAIVCDRSATIDPAAVIDMASFRAQASAGVCDFSLRCPSWNAIGDGYCHPSYATLVAERQGIGASPSFDLAAARTCVAQLAHTVDCDDALNVAWDCRQVDVGALVGPPEGSTCNACAPGAFLCGACSFELACASGRCTRTVGIGDTCDDAHPCEPAALCRGGTCEARNCALDDTPPRHHVGCACSSDDECPNDVAVCSNGRCALRPFVGGACSIDGPPCYASRCASGTCVLLRRGDGPCAADPDCEGGLVCVGGTCIEPVGVGGACGLGVASACVASCCGGTTCVPLGQRGEPCRCGCAAGLRCDFFDGCTSP